ncbi:hypothetical protein GCM10010377_80320 [Streptomyces viridiviolaceus]|nr:hypothetical protein GCM10010377_80320 [Streptomyces viridiviolaceus]
MTNTLTSEAATGTGDRSRPRAALPALCATQIVSWGIIYYAFPVLNRQITAATGWLAGATTAAFSLGLVVSALAGIRVGRILDRRGPRTVMTTGSVLGTDTSWPCRRPVIRPRAGTPAAPGRRAAPQRGDAPSVSRDAKPLPDPARWEVTSPCCCNRPD